VWAVGVTLWPVNDENYGSSAAQPLLEHWNGTAWSIAAAADPEAPPPAWAMSTNTLAGPSGASPVGRAALIGVAATSSTDVWAVGGYETDMGLTSSSPSPWETLAEHWNGSTWSVVPAPDVNLPEEVNGELAANDALIGAGASPDGTLWAVGGAIPESGLTFRLTAGSWQLVSSPAMSAAQSYSSSGTAVYGPGYLPGLSPLTAVAVLGPSDAWVVGAVILHWDGTAWEPLYTVNGESFGYLTGVSASSSSGLWAVGGATILRGTCA